MKILQGRETEEPPKLKRNQKLRLHHGYSWQGLATEDVTYKKLVSPRQRPYYIYVTCSNGSIKLVDIRDCEIVLPVEEACACDELTKSWKYEDRAALCGHVKACPRFQDNFKSP